MTTYQELETQLGWGPVPKSKFPELALVAVPIQGLGKYQLRLADIRIEYSSVIAMFTIHDSQSFQDASLLTEYARIFQTSLHRFGPETWLSVSFETNREPDDALVSQMGGWDAPVMDFRITLNSNEALEEMVMAHLHSPYQYVHINDHTITHSEHKPSWAK